MAYTTTTPARRRPSGQQGWLSKLLAAGRLHKERRALTRLSNQQLSDIGITRAEADAEANRGLWDVPNHWKR
nr:DUF1127 domain-containing protein [Amylibacter sp.]